MSLDILTQVNYNNVSFANQTNCFCFRNDLILNTSYVGIVTL